MKGFIRTLLLGFIMGLVVGWMMSQQKQAREAEAEREAYKNDPELVDIRKEIALERQLVDIMDNLEDKDD